MDRRFSLPYTHKIVNPEGIEAARAWFNAYSLNDYYSEMLRMEEELHPSDIFKCQNNITPADRAKLLHWIIRVCCSNVFECMHQVIYAKNNTIILVKRLFSKYLNMSFLKYDSFQNIMNMTW